MTSALGSGAVRVPPVAAADIVRISQGWDPPRHYGTDYACIEGTPVVASAAGVAHPREQEGGFGKYVMVETGTHYIYTAHLSQWQVRAGELVIAGQVIGLSGTTGNSTGPHVHFEVRAVAGSPHKYGAVDPEAWLRAREAGMDGGKERIVAARWHAEEAVRQIETTIAAARVVFDDVVRGLEQARERLVQETIPRLYEAAGERPAGEEQAE